MKFPAVAAFLSLLFVLSEGAKTYDKCSLARELKREGMAGYLGTRLEDWVCLAYHESGFRTNAIGPKNTDGSQDYGIFQINSKYWCKAPNHPSKNGCGKPCSSFINDDIKDDIVCAKRIVHDPNKLNAWVGWKKHCKGKDLSQWTRGCKL